MMRVIDKGQFILSFTTIHGSTTLLNAVKFLLVAMRPIGNEVNSFLWFASGSQDVKAFDSVPS